MLELLANTLAFYSQVCSKNFILFFLSTSSSQSEEYYKPPVKGKLVEVQSSQ